MGMRGQDSCDRKREFEQLEPWLRAVGAPNAECLVPRSQVGILLATVDSHMLDLYDESMMTLAYRCQ